MLLKNKVALITGGAGLNGLGFATARLMAEQGAHVVIMDLEAANPAAAAAQTVPTAITPIRPLANGVSGSIAYHQRTY